MKVGIVSGRFQTLHLKHIEYILAAKMRCERLYIGIEMPDEVYIAQLDDEAKCEWKRENPLTYIERHEMLCQALLEFGMEKTEFDIIPFPVHYPEYVLQYVPQGAIYFLGISTQADRHKRRTLEKLGVKFEILWNRGKEQRGITEQEVLDMIINDGEWEQHVPKSTVKYMKKEKLVSKIKDLAIESKDPVLELK
jgi:Nicotinamide mononucleotide adenylyltransferase